MFGIKKVTAMILATVMAGALLGGCGSSPSSSSSAQEPSSPSGRYAADASIRFPIHLITGTAMELPSAL